MESEGDDLIIIAFSIFLSIVFVSASYDKLERDWQQLQGARKKTDDKFECARKHLKLFSFNFYMRLKNLNRIAFINMTRQ